MDKSTLERNGRWALDSTPLDRSAPELTNSVAEHLAWAKAFRQRIDEVGGPRSVENTLIPFNELMMHVEAAGSECGLFRQVHPSAVVREAATAGEQQVSAYATELSLDRPLYEAVRGIDASLADAPTRYMLEKTLREFRRSGVDRSDDERSRISALSDEIVRIGQEFSNNIRDDESRRGISVDAVADLDGMPEDWIAKHPPGADGKIRISTRTPDYAPFLTYARNADARRRLSFEVKNRGFPGNLEVLSRLLARRHELAQMLGYANYAEYVTEDKMIGSASAAATFIDRVARISSEPAKRDYAALLTRKKKDDASATKVEDWEKSYYEQLVQTEQFQFDPQSVRPYCNFVDVRDGLFALTQQMFGVSYRKVEGLRLWHESVTAWDVWDGDRLIGRFYLDLHPREDKYGHAAQFDYRAGVAGRRTPQAVLVCNFPDPSASQDGVALMEHDDVVTFFHEFGHLLHALFAGHQKWVGITGISTERDFVEVPSQILEEWCFEYDALSLFARHHQTGEIIPKDMVARLRRASEFGKGVTTAQQMFYAAISLQLYSRSPQGLDTTQELVELQQKYSLFDYVPETHFQCNFGHLDGYSAMYYTYMWSKVISKDLYSRFMAEGVLNSHLTREYRKKILDPGGSDKAENLVADFLNRPHTFAAFEEWLHRQ